MPAIKHTCTMIFLLLVICGSDLVFAQNLVAGDVTVGVRSEFINETVHGTADGGGGTLEVDNVISPFVRMEYELVPAWHLELQGSVDIYGGSVAVAGPEIHGSSYIHGYTLSMAPVWHGADRTALNRTWRPVLKAGLRYAWLDNDLNFPVTSYKPAWGVDIACGLDFGQWEIRLNGTYIIHRNRSTLPDYTGDKELNLSRIGLEVAVPVKVICDFFRKD